MTKMRTIEECINDLVCDIENFIGGNITERQNELLNEILEIHKAEKRPKGKWIQIDSTNRPNQKTKRQCPNCGSKCIEFRDGYGYYCGYCGYMVD